MPKDLQENICDEKLFSSFFSSFSQELHNFLYYKYGTLYNPADKVQEAFIKLWTNCKKVTPSKAKGYLYTVANNMMLNEAKHQKIVLNYKKIPTQDKNNYNPEFLLEEKEYLEKYKTALSKLTEAQREVFLLNRVEGKRHKEIAELLGISRKAVEKRLYTALEKLRMDIKEL